MYCIALNNLHGKSSVHSWNNVGCLTSCEECKYCTVYSIVQCSIGSNAEPEPLGAKLEPNRGPYQNRTLQSAPAPPLLLQQKQLLLKQ